MRTHGPNCLEGPVSALRPGWRVVRPEDPELYRAALVEQVRGEIAAGTYETPEKWELALERLFDRLDPA